MQKLMVSIVRFTTALALYGLEQIQSVSRRAQGGQDLFKVVDEFQATLDDLTSALVDNIDEGKRDTLKSVTDIAEDVISKSNPRDVLRITSDLWEKSSDAMTDWLGKSAPTNGSEPKPAAEVLS
jgi:hypothetical protein